MVQLRLHTAFHYGVSQTKEVAGQLLMHGRMYMNKLKIIIPLAFLASCNSYYFPLWVETPQRILNSFKAYSPSEDYIKNQQFSFITVELGQQDATLVLSSIKHNIFTWVGRDNVTFKTYKGIIIETNGLEHNFVLKNPIESIDSILEQSRGRLIYDFDNPRLYELQVAIVGLLQSEEQIVMDLESDDIGWDAKISVKNGPKSLATETIQSLHPFLKDVKLRFYYKY